MSAAPWELLWAARLVAPLVGSRAGKKADLSAGERAVLLAVAWVAAMADLSAAVMADPSAAAMAASKVDLSVAS